MQPSNDCTIYISQRFEENTCEISESVTAYVSLKSIKRKSTDNKIMLSSFAVIYTILVYLSIN